MNNVWPYVWVLSLGFLGPTLQAQGLFPVFDADHRLWGYQNEEGVWEIPPAFYSAGDFQEGYAVVTLDSLLFISREGMVLPVGRRMHVQSTPWRPQLVIDAKGTPIWHIPAGYRIPDGAHYGLGLLPIQGPDGRYGYVDVKGELLFPLRWERAWSFDTQTQLAAVQISASQYDSVYATMARALQNRIDQSVRQWRKTASPKQLQAYPYGGMATVFINPSGQVEEVLPLAYLPPTFDQPFRWQGGFLTAQSLHTRQLGLLDTAWRIALPFTYDQLGRLQEGRLFAVHRPRYDLQGSISAQDMQDPLFVGYLDMAGIPIFSLPLDLLQGRCMYRVEGEEMCGGSGTIWLLPLDCEKKKGLRISTTGQLLEFMELDMAE